MGSYQFTPLLHDETLDSWSRHWLLCWRWPSLEFSGSVSRHRAATDYLWPQVISSGNPELSFLIRANAHLKGICFLTLAWQLDYGVHSGCSIMSVLQSLWCPAQTLGKKRWKIFKFTDYYRVNCREVEQLWCNRKSPWIESELLGWNVGSVRCEALGWVTNLLWAFSFPVNIRNRINNNFQLVNVSIWW